MEKNLWKKLSSKEIYANIWLSLREDQVIQPNGKRGIYSVVERPPGVFIIALTEKKEIYLVGQYRYPTNLYSWEIPGGGGAEEKVLLTAAKRELKEETGLEAKKWQKLGMLYCENSFTNAINYIFLAQELKQTQSNKRWEEGITRVKKVPFRKILKMIKNGEISDAQSIAVLMKIVLFLNILK